MMTLLLLLSAGVVMMRCLCIVAHMSPRRWIGHRAQFAGLAASYALIGGGSVGVALGWPVSAALLLFGVAGLISFDRRT